jgi:exodeoxyribonuclease VII small subunit
MSSRPELEAILGDLEKAIGKLADGTAPLDELVSAHERALRLLSEAQTRLAELKERADQTANLLST